MVFLPLNQEIEWFLPPSRVREQENMDISMFIKNRIWQMWFQAISPFAVNIFTVPLGVPDPDGVCMLLLGLLILGNTVIQG